jgi:hypothetical protein
MEREEGSLVGMRSGRERGRKREEPVCGAERERERVG